MSYHNRNMSVIAYANGWTMLVYQTNDPISVMEESLDYFPKQIVDLMRKGDVIYVVTPNGTYQRAVGEIKEGCTHLVKLL